MSKILSKLLEENLFPTEKDANINSLKLQVSSGNLGISISSFDEIYNMTPLNTPFPLGCVNFEDKKKRFVISWNEKFSKLNISCIEEYSIKIRNYPTEHYPVLSIIVGIHNGKVDSETGEDLWYYKDIHLDLALLSNRIKLYQLFNSDEILFCLFDGSVENLDSFGFSLNKGELQALSREVDSQLLLFKDFDFKNHILEFSKASKEVSSCFLGNGLPKSKKALDIYLKRKDLKPEPNKHNWKEYLDI